MDLEKAKNDPSATDETKAALEAAFQAALDATGMTAEQAAVADAAEQQKATTQAG
jgi:hypothetical protein